MELNSYQREVMGNLSAYLSALNETGDLNKAWQKYWSDQDVAVGLVLAVFRATATASKAFPMFV